MRKRSIMDRIRVFLRDRGGEWTPREVAETLNIPEKSCYTAMHLASKYPGYQYTHKPNIVRVRRGVFRSSEAPVADSSYSIGCG